MTAMGCAALASCASSPVSFLQPPIRATAEQASGPAVAMPPVRSRNGTNKPYVVGGKRYEPRADPSYAAVGLASWYGGGFHGRMTADGERFDMMGLTAAHKTMPLPSYARVTNMDNGMSIVVRVNDRGPYVHGRLIDVSRRAADLLQFKDNGVGKVKVEYVGRAPEEATDTRMLLATLRTDGTPAPTPSGAPGTMFADATPPTPPQPVPVQGDDVVAQEAPAPQAAPVAVPQLASADGSQLVAEAKRVAAKPETPARQVVAFNLASLPLPPERPTSSDGILGETARAGSVGQAHLHRLPASKQALPDGPAQVATVVDGTNGSFDPASTGALPTLAPTPAINASMVPGQ
ncbi:rare lipoprotein A [Labrys monachus]|uniref:Endolytic peptidoglycan transglycosylase RlpA n=2 Tax=Labrys monachus TaxID=217067 RepID=A0ABU0FF97_9HYPH|nr:septal ring lytic transglycosylase RlpA family protein [Labrys monachus]MDQ0393136.1 rare lipoprotein A [Labrys monachus]